MQTHQIAEGGKGGLTGRATKAGKLAVFYGCGQLTTEIGRRKNRRVAKK